MAEKRSLPIDIQEAKPNAPDIRWAAKMLGYLALILLAIYSMYQALVFGVSHYLTLEREQKIFGFIANAAFSGEVLENDFFSQKLPKGYDFPITLIESDEENAFATLGGKMLITTAFIDAAQNEEEVLFALGHELTHLKNQDALHSLIQSAPLTVLASVFGEESRVTVDQLSKLYSSYASRSAEEIADVGGVELLHALKRNTVCAVGFFERNMQKGEEFMQFVSTHPITQKRIQYLKENMGGYGEIECTPMKDLEEKSRDTEDIK